MGQFETDKACCNIDLSSLSVILLRFRLIIKKEDLYILILNVRILF
jgi:hypothetical protein